MRILVTGSRTWDDIEAVAEALKPYKAEGNVLVHGGAQGADQTAALVWTTAWKLMSEVHHARWKEYGKQAGFIRNKQMVESGIDVCLAFIKDGSHGATHCANLAEQSGIETKRFTA